MPDGAYRLDFLAAVVEKDIPALSRPVRERIKRAVETRLARDPMSFGEPLRYGRRGQRRLRVGDWRVVYMIDHEACVVTILAIGHRSRVYGRRGGT